METRQKRSSSGKTRRSAPASAARTQTRRKTATGKTAARKQTRRKATPDVVYTPPKPFNRNHLLLGLATAVAVVLALTFSVSIFFSVENVIVAGAKKYDAWTVREASGIEEGDSLLGINEPKAVGLIQSELPYADDVRISIKLPNTVYIEIKELDVWYSIRDVYDIWWLMTADGRVVEQVDAATAGDCTKVLGVQLSAPAVGHQAVAAEAAPTVDESGETIPITVHGSDRMAAVLSILQYLELNGIIGEAVSVDVTDLGKIEIWYGQQYQVNLGDTTQLNYKIQCMKQVINQLPDYETGVIDVSFTIRPDQPVYQSFD